MKGDVIKYVDKYVENEDMTGDKSIIPYQPIDKGISAYHRFTLGSAINGFSADYSLIQPMNDFLYWSLNIGYKNYSISGSSTGNYSYYNYNTGSYSYYPYSFPYDASFYTIPITFNFGVSAKSLINIPNIPLNPYASIGLAYVPMFGADQSGYSSIDDRFDQVGINFNIGAEYLLVKGLAVGLEYRYLKSFVDLPAPVNSGLGFSNLNISLTYHP